VSGNIQGIVVATRSFLFAASRFPSFFFCCERRELRKKFERTHRSIARSSARNG